MATVKTTITHNNFSLSLKEARKGFPCSSVCETMEDDKEGYLTV